MQTYLSALILFVISLLPAFPQKTLVENSLSDAITPKTVSEETAPIMSPDKVSNFQTMSSNAKSAYFADFDSGYVYFEKNADSKVPMASTTKLMTAITALLTLDKNQIVTVGPVNNYPLDTLMGLKEDDKIKVSELLHGLLINSGADAARTLAAAASGDEPHFVAAMNENASRFGLTNTQFTNAVGYDEQGHYSTAADMFKLTKIALSNPMIAEIVAKPNYIATAENGKHYALSNTNQLLTSPNIRGVKTGTTLLAGQCLIVLFDDGQHRTIGVILGSTDRYADTNAILDWTKSNFMW